MPRKKLSGLRSLSENYRARKRIKKANATSLFPLINRVLTYGRKHIKVASWGKMNNERSIFALVRPRPLS